MPTNLVSWVALVVVLMLSYPIGRGFARGKPEVLRLLYNLVGLSLMIFVAVVPAYWIDGGFLRIPTALAAYAVVISLKRHPVHALGRRMYAVIPTWAQQRVKRTERLWGFIWSGFRGHA